LLDAIEQDSTGTLKAEGGAGAVVTTIVNLEGREGFVAIYLGLEESLIRSVAAVIREPPKKDATHRYNFDYLDAVAGDSINYDEIPMQLFLVAGGRIPIGAKGSEFLAQVKFAKVLFKTQYEDDPAAYSWLKDDDMTSSSFGENAVKNIHALLKTIGDEYIVYIEGVLAHFFGNEWDLKDESDSKRQGYGGLITWTAVKHATRRTPLLDPLDTKWIAAFVGQYGRKFNDGVSALCSHVFADKYLRAKHGCFVSPLNQKKATNRLNLYLNQRKRNSLAWLTANLTGLLANTRHRLNRNLGANDQTEATYRHNGKDLFHIVVWKETPKPQKRKAMEEERPTNRDQDADEEHILTEAFNSVKAIIGDRQELYAKFVDRFVVRRRYVEKAVPEVTVDRTQNSSVSSLTTTGGRVRDSLVMDKNPMDCGTGGSDHGSGDVDDGKSVRRKRIRRVSTVTRMSARMSRVAVQMVSRWKCRRHLILQPCRR
jgi:hypothetical protein